MSNVIRVTPSLFKKIRKAKKHPRETDSDVIQRWLDAIEELRGRARDVREED